MATTETKASHQEKALSWLKNLGIGAAVLIIGGLVIKMGMDAWSDSSAGNGTNQLASQPGGVSVDGKPLQWQLFDRIECPVGWNDREGGPWCDSIELPNGSYRFIMERTLWKHADLGPDGTLSYFDIPPEGLPLSSFPAASHSFKREFWQGAPCGGNSRLGAVVIRTSTVNCYDPFARDAPPLVIASAKPKEKVLIGTNFPPNRLYVQADQGKIIIEVERLQ
jgi:hypothetical protein